jgi:hypothetical protein
MAAVVAWAHPLRAIPDFGLSTRPQRRSDVGKEMFQIGGERNMTGVDPFVG